MTLSATLVVMAATLAVCVAALCHWLSAAPGWRDLRLFSYVALSAAVYSALKVPSNLGAEGPWIVVCARAQLLVAAAHVVAWLHYARVHLGLDQRRWERWYERVLLIVCAFGLVPGLAYQEGVTTRFFAPLGFAYSQSIPTPPGRVIFAALLAVFALLAGRYWLAWRRGVPYAAVHCLGLVVLLAMGVSDALAVSSVLEAPCLLEVGYVVPVGAVAYSLAARFATDARDLSRLRLELETAVDERTRELACAVDALHHSEKLAALGQFAAGVAHEVNNPTAVVSSNLRYLAEAIDRGQPLRDARACIEDSLRATERITRVVRQLLDAGRVAASTAPCQGVPVAAAVEESIRVARARCGLQVRFESTVPCGLSVLAREDAVVQVLVNLLVNAVQAIPEDRRDGRVGISAEVGDRRVRILIDDNGAGMSDRTLARAFEPFFSTKPMGTGTGLGLAVSRGIIEGLGGELRLESRLGAGTRAIVELPEGEPVGDLATNAVLGEQSVRRRQVCS